MMNRRQATISLTIVGMALLVTVATMSLSTQALAQGHGNLDEEKRADNSDEDSTTAVTRDGDEEEGSEDSNDESNAEEDSSPVAFEAHVAYRDLQACLSNAAGQGSPTAEEVQGCVESSYAQSDSNEDTSTESGGNGVSESVSKGNTEDEEGYARTFDEDEDDEE